MWHGKQTTSSLEEYTSSDGEDKHPLTSEGKEVISHLPVSLQQSATIQTESGSSNKYRYQQRPQAKLIPATFRFRRFGIAHGHILKRR